MISMILYDKEKNECKLLIQSSKDAVAYCSDDVLEMLEIPDFEKVKQYLEEKNLLDAAFLDVTKEDGLVLSRKIRGDSELSELLLIADDTISPMKYLTPDIRAASLLLRPFTKEQSNDVVFQFFRSLYRRRNFHKESEKVLILENQNGKTAIPFSDIYFLEVKEKKISIRLKQMAYSKYDTLENMLKKLPDDFIRCHRSFVVNKTYIKNIKLSENTIYLENGLQVPLSRTYKATLKEYIGSLKENRG